jgi:hypothetical protein
MPRLIKILGERCDRCFLCNYARNHPETWVGKIMAWHGTWCPAWKAQQQLAKEREGRPS